MVWRMRWIYRTGNFIEGPKAKVQEVPRSMVNRNHLGQEIGRILLAALLLAGPLSRPARLPHSR